MKPLRVGIVGAGGIARNHHVPTLRRCKDVEVVGVCDIAPSALDQMREQHQIAQLFTDCRPLLDLDPDILSICTSNDAHYDVALEAMDRGIDVFCEKPLALNLVQAREMYACAELRGTKTGVNFSHRRTPAAQLAHEIIASEALGSIYQVSAVYAAGAAGYADRPGTWRNDRQRAGYGGLGDMGSHIIDMMLWWLGCDVERVTAQTRTFVHHRQNRDTLQPMQVTTEDQGNILVSYSNGALGYLCGGYCYTGRGYDQRVEVYGSEGGLMYDQQHPFELQVYLAPEHLDRYQVVRQGGTRDMPYSTIMVPERLQGCLEDGRPWKRTILMDYVDAYRGPEPFGFSPGFLEGVRVQEVLEACTLAESQRAWIDLPLP